jgi:hypothetical protein
MNTKETCASVKPGTPILCELRAFHAGRHQGTTVGHDERPHAVRWGRNRAAQQPRHYPPKLITLSPETWARIDDVAIRLETNRSGAVAIMANAYPMPRAPTRTKE